MDFNFWFSMMWKSLIGLGLLAIVVALATNGLKKKGFLYYLDKKNWPKFDQLWWADVWRGIVLLFSVVVFHILGKIFLPELVAALFPTWTYFCGFYLGVLCASVVVSILTEPNNKKLARKLAIGFIGIPLAVMSVNAWRSKFVTNVPSIAPDTALAINAKDRIVPLTPTAAPVAPAADAKVDSPAPDTTFGRTVKCEYFNGLPSVLPEDGGWFYVEAPANPRRDARGNPINWSKPVSFNDIAESIRGELRDVMKYHIVFKESDGGSFRWANANDPSKYVDMLPGCGGDIPGPVNVVKVASLTHEPCKTAFRMVLREEFRK